MTDEKTIDPTPHRRQQARAEGHVARSSDLCSAGMLLGGLVALVFSGGALLDYLAGFLTQSLGGQSWMDLTRSATGADVAIVTSQWNPLVTSLASVLLPPLALLTLLAVALNIVQTGFLFLPRKLAPDVSRVNPLAGIRRIFSAASAVRLSLGVGKLAIIAAVAFGSIYQRRAELVSIGEFDLPQVVAFLWDVCLGTCLKVGSALFILAMVDYGYERWRHERDLRMTPQELREEMRNLQGDPQVTARRRATQRQLTIDRSLAGVAGADLVIVDPAKAAVALRYTAHAMTAPVVVAKGSGSTAQRISELAARHGVRTVEKHSLAQALVQEAEWNQPIPSRQYSAVAEVLAGGYRAKSVAG